METGYVKHGDALGDALTKRVRKLSVELKHSQEQLKQAEASSLTLDNHRVVMELRERVATLSKLVKGYDLTQQFLADLDERPVEQVRIRERRKTGSY